MPLAFLKRNWFLLGILTAMLLGFLLPELAGLLNPRAVTRQAIVVLLFLIAGFTLPSESIVGGLRDIRLHVFLQLFIFLFVPVFFVLTTLPLRALWGPQLLLGIYALSCLPTTISSCIVFTQVSGGNLTGTVFNASLANMAGVILSPLILSVLMREAGRTLPFAQLLGILGNLALQMLLPIAAGQLLRQFFRRFAERHKRRFSVAGNLLVLGIVFFSFAGTAQNPQFMANLRRMLGPFGFLAVAHLVLLALAYLGARALRLSPQSTISALYTAPQKTLAAGAPLLSTYFAATPDILGVALLPLLFYHAWQLLVAGLLRGSTPMARLQRAAAAQEGPPLPGSR